MNEIEVSNSLNGFEFLWEVRNEIVPLRTRYRTARFQLACATLVSIIFLYNTWHSILVAYRYPRKLAPWCCLIIGILGLVVICTIAVPSIGFDGPSCNTTGWSIVAGVVLSTMAANVVLFERAYIACRRAKWLLVSGLFLTFIPGPVYMLIVVNTGSIKYTNLHGCYLNYPAYLPYVRAFTDLPQNIIFGVIFCRVIYHNYVRHREELWKELVKDGVITMLLVALSNITCFIIGESNVLGAYSSLAYITDWVIASTLLSENIYRIHLGPQTTSKKGSRKTQQSIHTDMPLGGISTTCRAYEISGLSTFHGMQYTFTNSEHHRLQNTA